MTNIEFSTLRHRLSRERGIRIPLSSIFYFLGFLSLFCFLLPEAHSQPLKPEQAFQIQASVSRPDRIEVTFTIAEGYYLYRDKIKFSAAPEGVVLQSPSLPQGSVKKDPSFGEVQIYRGELKLRIPFKGAPPEGQPISLAVAFQGCSDAGLCYPPKVQKFQLDPNSSPQRGEDLPAHRGGGDISGLFTQKNFFWVILTFFGFGLLLSLTPCVFPMIPILSGIIVAQGREATKGRSFLLSLIYVLGMALVYAGAGVLAGWSGHLIAASLQNPWVLGVFALIFVALALSMFGLYELKIPGSFQSKLAASSNRLKGGTVAGVFLMGMLSGLIIGPCVTPPLAGALIYISQTGSLVLGGLALFALALGMGVPLLVIGTSAGVLLPRAGEWMNGIKAVFGAILLGVAIWILSPLLPASLTLFLWGALLTVSSVYLYSLDPLPAPAGGWAKLKKGIGVLIFLIGIALVIGALTGGTDPFQPLSGIRPSTEPAGPKDISPASNLQPPTSPPAFHNITGLGEFEGFLKKEAGRPVMLYVGAEWCTACKELERFTFSDPDVQQALKGLRLFKADVTRDNEQTRSLLKKFGLFGPPAVMFFNGKGQEIPGTRVIGTQKAGEFLKVLDKANTS